MNRIISSFLGLALIFSISGCCEHKTSEKSALRSFKVTDQELKSLLQSVKTRFDKISPQTIRPAEGFLKYDYLIPAGFYKQMWDWDGFFIGSYHISMGKPQYLKYWVLSFVSAIDSNGFVSGRLTTKGPTAPFGKFTMKPFLAQGAYFASTAINDFKWLSPFYKGLKKVCQYRETTQFDAKYGLFFWDNSMESGADNNVVLSNDEHEPGAILGVDINTFQYREYLAMQKIAEKLGNNADAALYKEKAEELKKNIMKYHWNKDDYSFWNIRRRDGRAIKRVSYSNFIPLMQKEFLSDADGKEMIKRYLWNEDYMLSNFGIRSLAKSDPEYNNENIIIPYSNWQGPLWINANYMNFIGLKNYGFDNECRVLAYSLGKITDKDVAACGSMHECYDADTGEPLAPTAAQSKDGIFTGFVGWNLLVQDMLIAVAENKWMMLEIK